MDMYDGEISNSYAVGAARGNSSVGGLIGYIADGSLSNSYATGSVADSGDHAGGLVGKIESGGSIAGANYYVDVDGTHGIGNGTCSGSCSASMRQTGVYIRDSLDEGRSSELNWDGNVWNDLDVSGYFPCLRDPNNVDQCLGGNKVTRRGFDNGEGTGSASDPFLVGNWASLACVGSSGVDANDQNCSARTDWTLNAHYRLLNNINITISTIRNLGGRRDGNDGDCVAYDGDSGGANAGDLEHDETCAGWTPIGSDTNNFTGTFDGNGFRITNLYINRPTTDYVGLFGNISGASAVIRNLGVEVQIVFGRSNVGGLVGQMDDRSSISNSYATGAVTGSENTVGGLVGQMDDRSSISNSYATGAVTGSENTVGGLVGQMDDRSSISNSYATGAVTGSENIVGGLVGGMTSGAGLSNSYAMGVVAGQGNNVGGLVGGVFNSNISVTKSYATGSVTGQGNNVGGLVGYMYGSYLDNSYATGSVTGSGGQIGGLVGYMKGNGSIDNSYATGGVMSGHNNVGGLVGSTRGSLSNSYATGSVAGSGANAGGLVGRMESGGSITGANYYVDTSATYGVGNGSCSGTCTQQTLEQIRDALDEATALSWDIGTWGSLSASSSFPCLKNMPSGVRTCN